MTMKAAYSLIFLVVGLIYITSGVKEEEHHGKHVKQGHHRDSEDDSHYDHRAIIGDKDEEKEFDELEPEEAKRRLRILYKKMDANGDGKLSKKELTDWVIFSFQKLDAEDAEKDFLDNDENKDGKLTWKEYVTKQYGYDLEDLKKYQENGEDFEDFNQLIDDEKLKFDTADLDKDGSLDKKEHIAFMYPYDFEHMHEIEMKRTMDEHDKDKDGKITLEEYYNRGENVDEDHNQEWLTTERERFEELDADKDGVLVGKELNHWILPDNTEAAEEEADHLIDKSDMDKDEYLSVDEVVDNHETFVGSQATNYGEYLPKDEL